MVPRLEPKDLYDRRIRRDYARLRAYNTLLEQIYNRVYTTSQLSGNTSSVLYSVPPFLLGLPKLDMEDCIVYLVWQLRQTGFEVRFTWPNLLFISWKHHEQNYLTNQNPIVKAMKPSPMIPPKPPPVPKPIKKTPAVKTVTFDYAREIDMITATPYYTPPMNTSPKNATEYQPPASFVQTIERPGPGRISAPSPAGTRNVLADLWSV